MGDTATTRKPRAETLLDVTPLLAMLAQWPDAILLFDSDARLYWSNTRALRLIGTERADTRGLGAPALGLPWLMAPEQFVAASSGTIVQFRAGPVETPHRYDVCLRRIEVGDARHAVVCTVAEHVGATALASGSEREQSFDAAQAGMWRWDLQSGEAFVDEAWCRHQHLDPCGGAEHEARWAGQIHPDDSTDYRRRLAELRSGAATYFEDEYRILTLENQWLWILQRGRVVARAADGTPLRVIGICIDIDRRKREETASKANESRLATALWGARAAFWQWHLPTDVRTMSPMWYAMTRYTREQWDSITDPWLTRLHPDDRDVVIAAVDRYCSGAADSLEYEYRLKIASGEWKWMLDRARAVEWDLEGNTAVIMGVSLDIDAQKRAEVELRASEDRLQTAVWGARMGLWETDLSTDTTRWFDHWCAQYGIDPCEGADHQRRWLANIHPSDAAGAAQRYQNHLDGEQDFYDSEYRVKTSNGSWRWIYARARITERDENNAPRRMVGVCMDVDARCQAEMQKHFTQPWLETALSVARGAMWHWQVEPFEVTYTDSYYRLFGFDPLIGRAQQRFWYNHLHPEDRERATQIAQGLVDGKTELYEQEYRVRCADGRWMWVLDRACVLLRDAQGKGQQMVGFVLDFTERRAQREALRATDQLFRYATMAARGMIFEVDFATGQISRICASSPLGYHPDEIGNSRADWIALVHPEDLPTFDAARPMIDSETSSGHAEYRVRHKDGHWVRVRTSAVTLTDAAGVPMRRVGFLQVLSGPDQTRCFQALT
jgi:PAS domain S-box-containing protein